MIFPADDADSTALSSQLGDIATGLEPVELLDPDTNTNVTLMWVGNITNTQVEQIGNIAGIAEVAANGELEEVSPVEEEQGQVVTQRKTRKAKRNLMKINTDEWDLIQLSTPEGMAPSGTYDYDESAGAGVTVYVIDNSFLMTHDEFAGGSRSVREMKVPGEVIPISNDGASFHGTCAASKAIGNSGVSERHGLFLSYLARKPSKVALKLTKYSTTRVPHQTQTL